MTGDLAMTELQKNGQYESLGEALSVSRHAVEKIDPTGPHSRGAEYYANNPGQQLRAWFSGDGIELASGVPTQEDSEPWSLKLRLRGVGREGDVIPVGPGIAEAKGGRVEMRHSGVAVSQWFENRTEGIEQGFTFSQRPPGTGPLEVVMTFEGNLTPVVLTTGENPSHGVCFADKVGGRILSYTGLKAWDAKGHEVPARIDVREGLLALVVADANAHYPLTVDPLFANLEQRLTEESVAEAQFGSDLALSGDTAIIGAHGDTTPAGVNAGSAYVFTLVGTTWLLQAKLKADNGAPYDRFGWCVALSGDTALVGMRVNFNYPEATEHTSAYVFVRNGAVWSQQARLTRSQSSFFDSFGESVALVGDTALVGASADDTAAGTYAGSAYVFVRSGTTWSQQQRLMASGGAGYEFFGWALALTADTALISAPGDETAGGSSAGSAYVFVRSGSTWTEQANLAASDGAPVDNFGWSVALSGDTACVGSANGDTTGGEDSGSAYVFVRSGSTWSQQAKLIAGDGASSDNFGVATAVSGDTVVVGAENASPQARPGAGCAYIFARSGGNWSQQAKLTAINSVTGDSFGGTVAISGANVLVGARNGDTIAGIDAGCAYIFARSGTTWSEQVRLIAGEGARDDAFGRAVAMEGGTVVVGLYQDDTMAGSNAGSAYVFERDGSIWRQQAKLVAVDGMEEDGFGSSVALSGDSALIGAEHDDTPVATDAGSAYVFVRSGTIWSEQAKVIASDGESRDLFGSCVALSGDTALIGASSAVGNLIYGDGGAYVFTRGGATWTQQTKLVSGVAPGLGVAVSLVGDTALVAAAVGNGVRVFVRNGGVWSEEANLTGGSDQGFYFGWSVALSGETALVGDPYKDTPAGQYAGAVRVFVRAGTTWSPQAELAASNGADTRHFGWSVALSGDTAVVGSPHGLTSSGANAGSAHVFVRVGTSWIQQSELTAGLDASAEDCFGISVALSGNHALVGAHGDDTIAGNAGSAYLFLLGDLPEITQQPQARTVVPGQSVVFQVAATGHDPLRYQWRKNGYLIAGANSPSHSIPSAQPEDQGSYDCVVSNIGGVVTSATATLSVNALSAFDRCVPAMAPDAQGFVFVSITPPGMGGWRFAGEQQWRASWVPAGGLATGDRLIEFQPVTGYLQPPPETVGVVSGGTATFLERTYYNTPILGTGSLTVILKPDDIADPPTPTEQQAQWRLLGEDDSFWRNSGELRTGLVAGNHLIECRVVEGRATPLPATVTVQADQTAAVTITYFLADSLTGNLPAVLPFETVTAGGSPSYQFVGQIRGNAGSASGFVVKPRVVATAGHVVFDDSIFAAATGLQWLFQRDRASHEPKPKVPRGFYIFDGYSARRIAENTPGSSTPESQNLDAAALYFLEDAGRGGFSGFMASDAEYNEFLLSSSLKTLVGYPVDGIIQLNQGRMHATAPADTAFTRSFGRTYTTLEIRGMGGMSGGPMCVQHDNGFYYPAAIYLGGSGQTVVRAIDSQVINLFTRAEVSGNGGDNNTGGGITHTSVTGTLNTTQPGSLKVIIEPAAARTAGAGWRLKPETTPRASGIQKSGLNPGTYVLEFSTVSGFPTPTEQSVIVTGGQLMTLTFTYGETLTALESWRLTNFGISGNTGIAADSADPDGDGQPNLSEYAANTNPNNVSDVFKVLTTHKTGSTFTVTAFGKIGRLYSMQRRADLSAGGWETVASQGPMAADAPVSLTDNTALPDKAFYRIQVLLP